ARLAELRGERARLLQDALAEARRRLASSADRIVADVDAGSPGWADRARALIEERRGMLTALAADENPFYTVFREMKDDMGGYALRMRAGGGGEEAWSRRVEDYVTQRRAALKARGLSDAEIEKTLSADRERMLAAAPGDRGTNDLVLDQLDRALDGPGFAKALPGALKLAWDVFTGREPSAPAQEVGLTRLYAARMLRALSQDPTMPAHQRSALTRSLLKSLFLPRGINGEGTSWVRQEAMRQFKGYFEDPAGIRFDSRTGRINVVHNGQWFESMDNETRRFWELHYGADLTLPYTNQSISTIKDVTMNRKARFVSFSGTAGEELRRHFKENGIRIIGDGSTEPIDPERVRLETFDRAPAGALDEIAARLGRTPVAGDVVSLGDFAGATLQWLKDLPPASAVEMDVVPGPSDRFSRIDQAFARVNGSGGRVVVDGLDGAAPDVRMQIEARLGAVDEPRVVRLADFSGPDQAQARAWLEGLRERQGDADRVVVAKEDAIPADARPAIDAYLAKRGIDLAKKDRAVVRISDVEGADAAQTEAARRWLRAQRANQGDTSLIVLSVSDTRVLKAVRQYLTRVEGLKPEQISMVFSDAEYLRNNVPEAKVKDQMNLQALDDGSARVLILDTRVGGRGLDLNFKGDRGSSDPKAFRGYTNFEMMIVDPQKMSQVHLLQAEGRIDVGRVLAGAARDFALVMDIRSVSDEAVFRNMISRDSFFAELRADPDFQAYATLHRVAEPGWKDYDAYVRERAAVGDLAGLDLLQRYRAAVKRNLEIQQGEVEHEQLSSSSVSQEPGKGNTLYPALQRVR
ncbi:MAG: hypothetical protein KGM24_05675, partial [Elusimicrobia bacterium]|nr:hypothetical protein [Elusimicrobiota bacterium]